MNIVVQHKCPATGSMRIYQLKNVCLQDDNLVGDYFGVQQHVAISEVGIAFVAETDSFVDIRELVTSGALPVLPSAAIQHRSA